MIRQLQPQHENLGKRQVKAPKIYFRDTGLLHSLMAVKTTPQLLGHPQSRVSWEEFALEKVLRIAQPDQACFWVIHNGTELDLLLFKGVDAWALSLSVPTHLMTPPACVLP